MSAVIEKVCTIVIGASGMIAGLGCWLLIPSSSKDYEVERERERRSVGLLMGATGGFLIAAGVAVVNAACGGASCASAASTSTSGAAPKV